MNLKQVGVLVHCNTDPYLSQRLVGGEVLFPLVLYIYTKVYSKRDLFVFPYVAHIFARSRIINFLSTRTPLKAYYKI